jgi:hypothetical protein
VSGYDTAIRYRVSKDLPSRHLRAEQQRHSQWALGRLAIRRGLENIEGYFDFAVLTKRAK